jgi:hypothetical protein
MNKLWYTDGVLKISGMHRSHVAKFGMVAPNIFIIAVFLLTYRIVYQFTYTENKSPDNSKVHTLLQTCGS